MIPRLNRRVYGRKRIERDDHAVGYHLVMAVIASQAWRELVFPTSPHIVSPDGQLVGYFTDPPGAMMQFAHAAKGTEAMARWLLSGGVQQLFSRFPHHNELIFVMDLRMMTGRELGARALLIETAPKLRHRFSLCVIIPPLIAPPFYAGTLHTAAALLRTMNVNIEIEPMIEKAFAKAKLGFAAR